MKFFLAICITFLIFGCNEPNTISKVIDFEVIKESEYHSVSKSSIDIRLNEKVSKEELLSIANSLRKDRKRFKRLYIAYYLPGMEVGAGAWATTHFIPELEVKILGLTTEEEEKMVNAAKNTSRDVVGIWMDDRPYVGATVTLYRENQRLYLESRYKDGSGSTDEMTESQLNNAIKLEEKGGNPHGEYFVLDKNGQLQAGGNNGLFLKYKKLK
ncbi:TPA: hypothetical protein AB5E44_003361 [Vibrio cholerae]